MGDLGRLSTDLMCNGVVRYGLRLAFDCRILTFPQYLALEDALDMIHGRWLVHCWLISQRSVEWEGMIVFGDEGCVSAVQVVVAQQHLLVSYVQ